MLHDLKRLLDRHDDLSEADFKEAANALLTRQFLYLDNDRRHYLRIPRNLDTHSTASWTVIPREAGQSERSDAGVWFYSGRPFVIKFSAS